MSKKQYPPIEFVRQAVREENGKLYWLTRPLSHFATKNACGVWNSKFAGHEAGYLLKDRWILCISGNYLMRYHIVWAFHKGEWPQQGIDHRNRNALDDRISNLRLCTQFQNVGNVGIAKNNTSGFKGVSWRKSRNKWIACIYREKKRIYLGSFDQPEEAHLAYAEAAKSQWGEFACNG